ncbi:MAG: hypothetical protein A2Z71_08090 [Chloroflexi bacterium RBG_13_50_21]|nr:MAG: hypothetical protein A2Z71_08090 [Chloroflexi bacterium RBG_13_50_21]
MRVNLLIIGTRGDVQPAVALGMGLKKAGFDVWLGAFGEFRSLAEAYGLGFIPLSGNVPELLKQGAGKKTFTGTAFFELLKLFQKMFSTMFTEFWQVSQGCDLLISNAATTMVVEPVAEKLYIPHIETSIFPGLPTRAFPSFFGPWPPSLGAPSRGLVGQMKGALNWFSYKPVNWAVALGVRPIIERCRRDILGLPARKPQQTGRPITPILSGFSQHVLPRPVEWGEHLHITGYWYLDTPDFEPLPDLQAFLEAGTPPVYIGFGSMPSENPEQVTEMMIQALALSGQRGILFTGRGPLGRGMAQQSSTQPVYFVESIPHDWLLPRTAAVVHHGGAGTTAAGIRAGIPSILIPIGADQRLWAYRVKALGVGPAPIPRSRLSAERLAKAITRAAGDPAMRQRAVDLREKVRAEDGVGEAVRIICQYMDTKSQGN